MKETINLHFIANYQDTKNETISKMDTYMIDGKWKNLTADINKPADYYIIQNHPSNNKYIPEKSILFYNEPILTRKKWAYWEKKANLLYSYKERNWTGWSLRWSYNDLLTRPIFKMEEKNIISTITSDLQFYPGHRRRLNMLRYLDDLTDDIIPHIYGKKNYFNSPLDKLKQYRGELKYKDIGLFKYHYHFAAENSQEDNYFTEKLIDPILTETLCFYWGCKNVKNYIPEKSFIEIDITRPEKALEVIKTSMRNNERDKRLKYIKEAKHKILTELSIMPLVHSVIEKLKPKI